MLLGFDPGRDKCGVAIVDPENLGILLHEVVISADAIARMQRLMLMYQVDRIILGDQTASKIWKQQLQEAFPAVEIVTVDERNSSLEARDRYWLMFPPQGLMRLAPKGMRQPPRPIDDIVAILLVERYLSRS